jgi:hypothetical protein
MTHNQIVLNYLLEFGGGAVVLALVVAAVVWWRNGRRARRLGVALAIILCLPTVGIAAHSRTELANARSELCVGSPPRFLCGGGGGGGD